MTQWELKDSKTENRIVRGKLFWVKHCQVPHHDAERLISLPRAIANVDGKLKWAMGETILLKKKRNLNQSYDKNL